jgi:hypothetical protein
MFRRVRSPERRVRVSDDDPLNGTEAPEQARRNDFNEGAEIPPEAWVPVEVFDSSDWADTTRPEPRYEGGRRSPLPGSPLNG